MDYLVLIVILSIIGVILLIVAIDVMVIRWLLKELSKPIQDEHQKSEIKNRK